MRGRFTLLALLGSTALIGGALAGQAVLAQPATGTVTGRVMWAALQWMGRLYILTDLRIIRLSGVFSVDLFDCPLRKVARTRLTTTMRERLFGLGSIEISPSDSDCPAGQWQTISSPREVHEQIVATINRAKQSGELLRAVRS